MTDLSRRALLGLAAALPLAACTGAEAPPPPPDPDDALRDAAVARERALLRLYDALPAPTPAQAAVRTEHAEHLAALLGAAPSPAALATPAAPATPAGPVAPAALVAAEREAGAAHGRAALAASRELAALLASLSASETSHPVALA